MDPVIDHSSPVPLHAQVEAYLRELIRQEEYRGGALLPNELTLSKRFGISRNTFRTAMDRLVLEGLVVRKKGIGSRVNTAMLTTTLTEWDSFSREMTTKGRVLRTIAKEISWISASEEVAAAMDIQPGTQLCCLRRVKGVDGEPVVLFLSYFHPRVGIRTDETCDGRLYDVLQQRYDSIPEISEEEIGALPAGNAFSHPLRMPPEVPVLFRKRRVLNAAGKILELCYAYYRSDRFCYTIRIHRGKQP